MVEAAHAPARRNRDCPWHEFDTELYYRHNYVDVREDDQAILEIVRDYFAWSFGDVPRAGIRGIDVGTGPNLYPALTMLPFCENVTLFDFSVPNVRWLMNQRSRDWPSWDEAWNKFWKHLSVQSRYAEVSDPKNDFSGRVEIVRGSVLDLQGEQVDRRWDVGTMFFVAESMTEKPDEFRSAIDHFFGVLKPGAPFAMAFMEHSVGYGVRGRQFPAIDIDGSDVSDCLSDRASEVRIDRIGLGPQPVRVGYTGMIVACGRVGKRLPAERR